MVLCLLRIADVGAPAVNGMRFPVRFTAVSRSPVADPDPDPDKWRMRDDQTAVRYLVLVRYFIQHA